jgi:hypothetical protein
MPVWGYAIGGVAVVLVAALFLIRRDKGSRAEN